MGRSPTRLLSVIKIKNNNNNNDRDMNERQRLKRLGYYPRKKMTPLYTMEFGSLDCFAFISIFLKQEGRSVWEEVCGPWRWKR